MKLINTTIFCLLIFSSSFAQDSIEKAQKSFRWIDANGDGYASMEEYLEFFKERKNNKTGEPLNIPLYFFAREHNGDNKISLEEFAAKPNWPDAKQRALDFNSNFFGEQQQVLEIDDTLSKRKDIFNSADTNQDKSINLKEYKVYAKKNGFTKRYKDLFNQLDNNSDKKLNIEEFRDFNEIELE